MERGTNAKIVKTSGFFRLNSFSMSNVSNYFALRSMQLLFHVCKQIFNAYIRKDWNQKEIRKRVQKHTFSAARHKNVKSTVNEHSYFLENEFPNIIWNQSPNITRSADSIINVLPKFRTITSNGIIRLTSREYFTLVLRKIFTNDRSTCVLHQIIWKFCSKGQNCSFETIKQIGPMV